MTDYPQVVRVWILDTLCTLILADFEPIKGYICYHLYRDGSPAGRTFSFTPKQARMLAHPGWQVHCNGCTFLTDS